MITQSLQDPVGSCLDETLLAAPVICSYEVRFKLCSNGAIAE
jgi:hypothetical protein